MSDDRRVWLMIFCLALVVRLLAAWLLTRADLDDVG